GEIKVFGKDLLDHEVEIKSRIGFVYDIPCFYEFLTLKQMKAVIAPFYKSWNDETFHRYMDAFDLPLKKRIKKLSRGMTMKFALALALSHDADLIIMDEPTSGLDPVFRRELLDILSDLIQDEGKSILFSTHVTSDLEKVADYITFIHNGELIFSSGRDEVFENYAVVKGGRELLTEEHRDFFVGYRDGRFGVEALTDNLEEARRKFKNLEGAVVEKANLEDIMFYTGQKGKQNV
ncbi:MAG: ABC transporter ATP-binding protein, partial [bacterium]|nr:ABC transporter ATP-binding protein [bacterium]